MAYNRPTLKALLKRVVADVETATGKVRARLRHSPEGKVANAVAGFSHGLHGHLVHNLRQMIPSTADKPYLRRWMQILMGDDIKEPSYASGPAVATGTNGVTTLDGHIWQRQSDGAEYAQVGDAEVENGQMDFTVQSTATGPEYNMEAGEILESATTVLNLDPEATVTGDGITGGSEEEDTEVARARLEDHLAAPRVGGTKNEYRDWALQVPGITRVKPIKNYFDPGSMLLIVDTDTGEPSQALVDQVFAHVEALKPEVDDLYVEGAKHFAQPFAIKVEWEDDVVTPADIAAGRKAIEAELDIMIRDDGGFDSKLYRSRISEAISRAKGEKAHELVQPAEDVTFQIGQVPDRGPILWVE